MRARTSPRGRAFGLAAALCLAVACTGERTREPAAAVWPTGLEVSPRAQWLQELGYGKRDTRPLGLSRSTGCPSVDVAVAGTSLTLLLDTGTARGFMLTTAAPRVPCRVTRQLSDLDAQGRSRGSSTEIRVDSIVVLGASFPNAEGTLVDWRLYASTPFTGAVGLDFFADRRLTLDYVSRTVAVTAAPLPQRLDPERYLVLELVRAPARQGRILYARAVVNGQPALVYVDTGYSASWIDPRFAGKLERVERPGGSGFRVRGIPLELGGRHFVLDDVREQLIDRGGDVGGPVALVLGSDILRAFVVTIDVRAQKLVLALAG